jgi:hypothetical protein
MGAIDGGIIFLGAISFTIAIVLGTIASLPTDRS